MVWLRGGDAGLTMNEDDEEEVEEVVGEDFDNDIQ
jgi:hypothetical protein